VLCGIYFVNSSYEIWLESGETEFTYIRWISLYRDVVVALTCPTMCMAHSIAFVRTGAAHNTNQAVTYNAKNCEPGLIKSPNLSRNMKP
jgi:hypothetical protein